MDTNFTNVNINNSIVINNLAEYTYAITEFRNKIIDEGKSDLLFFRGQNDKSWDIRPSIFRDSLITAEYRIIQTAMTRVPQEFRECASPFEELTKLQHYGLPTRLLDVTMNPLVALYFACYPPEIMNDDGNETYNDGVVYIGTGYGEHERSFKSEVLSTIAKINFTNNFTLKELKKELSIAENLQPEQFINLIQDTIFVMPSYSNTRLIQQCGAFLITGAVNIYTDEDNIWNSKVTKSVRNLNPDVDKSHIIISGDTKALILDELDFFNINESTLFPELEHQMSHIKRVSTKWITEESISFIRYETQKEIDININENGNNKLTNEVIDKILNKNITIKNAKPKIKSIITNITTYPDWNIKENTINELIMKIKRQLRNYGYKNAKEIASAITEELIYNMK